MWIAALGLSKLAESPDKEHPKSWGVVFCVVDEFHDFLSASTRQFEGERLVITLFRANPYKCGGHLLFRGLNLGREPPTETETVRFGLKQIPVTERKPPVITQYNVIEDANPEQVAGLL
jgi:hypothetical protein